MQQADQLKSPSFCLAAAVSTHTEEYQGLMAEHVTWSAFQTSLKLECASGKTELTTVPRPWTAFFKCNLNYWCGTDCTAKISSGCFICAFCLELGVSAQQAAPVVLFCAMGKYMQNMYLQNIIAL